MKKGIMPEGSKKGMIRCEECVLAKGKKCKFPIGKHTSNATLDYIYSDLCGPSQVNSIGGGRYYMSIIDDCSMKLWIYILKEKSEVFTKFKNWCMEVEVEKATPVRVLRTDNGLEYLSQAFNAYCAEKGIKRHKTVPCNPQQNGVAERMNRTVFERVRSMLFTSGLPKKFRGKAAATAAVLISKCPSSAIGGETPVTKWYGTPSDYTKLRIFGCKALAHIKQGKLEPRAIKCVMLGYQKGVKGYRLWCIELGKQMVIISRDVVFFEGDMPFSKVAQLVPEKEGDQVEVEHQHEDVNEEDKEVTERFEEAQETQQDDLSNYQLARDRQRRVSKPPSRFGDADMLYYSLCVAGQL